MQIDSRVINNILVVRNDRFGEFLLIMPALRALKETFTNARVIAVVKPFVKELAENIPFIDEIIEWDQTKHSLSDKLRFIKLLRKKKIDIAVMLNPSKGFNIFSYLAGIPVRLGYDRKWGFLLTHKMKDRKYLGERHEAEYNLELVSLIGAVTQDKSLIFPIDDRRINDLCADFNITGYDNLIALHPWTSDPAKQWPLDSFRKLTERLIKELDLTVLIVGGKEELIKSKELFKGIDANLINLTGKTTLIQLGALLKKCKMIISGDSGPVHLASAVGTKVLAIFRNDITGKSSRRWGPWDSGHLVIEKNRLCDISVAEVFDKAQEALNR